EGERPGRCGREHVARLQHVTVRGRIADREIEVAQDSQTRQQGRRQAREIPPGSGQQHRPADDREQSREEAEDALVLPASTPDPEVVPPTLAVRPRNRFSYEVR